MLHAMCCSAACLYAACDVLFCCMLTRCMRCSAACLYAAHDVLPHCMLSRGMCCSSIAVPPPTSAPKSIHQIRRLVNKAHNLAVPRSPPRRQHARRHKLPSHTRSASNASRGLEMAPPIPPATRCHQLLSRADGQALQKRPSQAFSVRGRPAGGSLRRPPRSPRSRIQQMRWTQAIGWHNLECQKMRSWRNCGPRRPPLLRLAATPRLLFHLPPRKAQMLWVRKSIPWRSRLRTSRKV